MQLPAVATGDVSRRTCPALPACLPQPGDTVVLVNGKSVSQMTFEEVDDSVHKNDLGLVALRFRRPNKVCKRPGQRSRGWGGVGRARDRVPIRRRATARYAASGATRDPEPRASLLRRLRTSNPCE